MAATVTVTGKAGPAVTITSGVFTGVSSFDINCNTNILTMVQDSVVRQVDINAATTITATKSSSTYTLTIS